MARGTRWGVAVPTEIDGIRFASKREAAVYGELKLRERVGEITGLKVHPRFALHAADGSQLRAPRKANGALGSQYFVELDFAYFEGDRRVVIDVKGADNPMSRLKRSLVEAEYKVRVEIVR